MANSPLQIDISVLGDHELDRAFAQLPYKAQRKLLIRAMRPSGKQIKADAEQRAPRSDEKEHGKHMADTIRLRVRKSKKRDAVGVRIMTGTREELGIDPDDPYYYPLAVEMGHARAPAQPFMRTAVKKNEHSTIAATRRALRELVL